jgi:hypothetical protein
MHSSTLPRALAAAVFTLVLATSPVTGHAAPDAQFRPAFQLFNQASAGDKGAVDAAADAFDALLQAEPASPVLMAYSGASIAMKARTTVMPWKKIGFAEDGLATLDKALALLTPAHDAIGQHGTPASLETRFVAASTFLAVPDFMHRGARGSALLAEVLASPLFAQSPLPFQAAVWMRAGTQAAKENRVADARRFFEQVVQRGAPQAEQARAALQGLPS